MLILRPRSRKKENSSLPQQMTHAKIGCAATQRLQDHPQRPHPPPKPRSSPSFSTSAKCRKRLSRGTAMLAYDDIYAAQYFGENLKGYWAKDGAKIGDLLQNSALEYATLKARCAAFDKELMADLEKAGGPKYAWAGCSPIVNRALRAKSSPTRKASRFISAKRTRATAAWGRSMSSIRKHRCRC